GTGYAHGKRAEEQAAGSIETVHRAGRNADPDSHLKEIRGSFRNFGNMDRAAQDGDGGISWAARRREKGRVEQKHSTGGRRRTPPAVRSQRTGCAFSRSRGHRSGP